MKRVGNLYPELTSFGHLLKSYKKALCGSGYTHETEAYNYFLESRLLRLQETLQSGMYKPGPFRHFEVYVPKRRRISVASFEDRIVHHGIVSILDPIYERCFIHRSYATRQDKGTHKAIAEAHKNLCRYHYYMKMDIAQYFHSIRHEVLLNLLSKKIKDVQFLNLIERIVCHPAFKAVGLPIGNLTSQFFANVYLNEFDHAISNANKTGVYIRYMDDFLLFSDSREILLEHKDVIRSYLSERLFLRIKDSATLLQKSSQGLPYLGTVIYRGTIRVRRSNLKRSIRRLRKKEQLYNAGIIGESSMLHSVESIIGHLKKWNSYCYRKKEFGYES